jgi:hypothetical protein
LSRVSIPTTPRRCSKATARSSSSARPGPTPARDFVPSIFLFSFEARFPIAASGLLVNLFFRARETSASADYFGLPPWLYLTLFLGIPALAIGNTAVVYFYFHDPTRPPLFKFLESAQAETVGDLLLFLNMIGYQVFWALLMTDITKDYSSIGARL